MSSSNFLLKPPVLFTGLVLIALIALSAGLQKQAENTEDTERVERTKFDRIDTGSTRISRIDAPSAVSSRGQSTAKHAPTAKRKGPRKQIVEDFSTALARAEGDSHITGRVFGSDRERQSDNDDNDRGRRFERRSRDNDDNTTSRRSSDDQGRRWSELWDRMKPLEGAQVMLYEDDPHTTHPPLRTAVTDKEGSYTLPNLNDADQRYIMVIKAADFAPEATYVSVTGEPRTVNVRLETGFGLRGKVLDKETSEPVANALVYQPNPHFEAFAPLGVTTTSLNGEFHFPNTHPGRLLTQAVARGYATTKARVSAPDNDTIIEMQSGGASLSGVTIDRLTGKPQGGARVWAKEQERRGEIEESVISAEDGTFTIENLPEGTFEVYAVRGMKSESQEVTLERRQQVTDVELILPTELLVSGQVLHATERQPLQGIKVWFESTKGAQFRETNSDGRFAFETMAVDEYAILIHEKGFLPIQDKRTTDAEETIVRKVAKNQSSDEVTIRLRPVKTLEGNVKGRQGWGRGRGGEGGGNNASPVNDAEVTLSYVEGRDLVVLDTKSDPAGNFFFNLPKGRGEGIVVAKKDYLMDSKEVRVPRERPVQLNMQRNFMSGRLLLSDESSLDGVRVEISRWIPRERADSNSGHLINLNSTTTMRGGRVFSALPEGEDVELTFYMPDGVAVTKDFKTNRLLNSRPIFVYDPVSQDIVAETTPRNGGRGRADRGEGSRGGNGNGGRRRNNGNNPAGNNGNQGGNNRAADGAQGGNNRPAPAPAPVQPASAPAQ